MKLYLDTFDTNSWQKWMPMGLFYGITTNPILAERAGLFYSTINWQSKMTIADELNVKEFHVQIPSCDEEAINFAAQRKDEAESFNLKLVIKVPLTKEGIRLVPELKKMGLSVLMTACYSAKQYIIADAIDADYIAPYYGRMEESGRDAFHHLSQMIDFANHSDNKCKILVASIRSVDQIAILASKGHVYFTIAPHVADDLISDDLTIEALTEFNMAASKVKI